MNRPGRFINTVLPDPCADDVGPIPAIAAFGVHAPTGWETGGFPNSVMWGWKQAGLAKLYSSRSAIRGFNRVR